MATALTLKMQLQGLEEEFFRRNSIAEENRLREHCAAVKIQSCFRGFKIRAHIRYVQKIAIIIQKTWRGYRSRMEFRSMVQRAYFIMKMNFYNEMAVRIQKTWRGYYVRKCIHNYYDMKKYFKGLRMKNEIVRKELEEYEETKKKEREKKALEEEERRKHYQARKIHYLLSTEQLPGIYNSPYLLCPNEMECRLQQVRPLTPNSSQKKDITEGLVDPSIPEIPCTSPSLGRLPHLGWKKPQGPFRDTAEVLQLRYKPLEPTLRVATSIMSEKEAREEMKREEWRNRIHDDIFLPFSNTNRYRTYEPLLHTSTKYEPIAYGTKHFRATEDMPSKKKPFRTVFKSIHLFEKLQKSYSKAGQVC
ncbi:spermatogenesis-associated protein 17 [Chiloscyllium plagiosum]|uniref:spermatogenesis-associated protein 17 n=1 Tax=Chiloscyllium plagiosum TaxID=36176 RepID=UPI001CB829BA|nr:spermatogenesis-associated protein 17 [Chiloscyllium plagiosum]